MYTRTLPLVSPAMNLRWRSSKHTLVMSDSVTSRYTRNKVPVRAFQIFTVRPEAVRMVMLVELNNAQVMGTSSDTFVSCLSPP